jgi:hypothetical protein
VSLTSPIHPTLLANAFQFARKLAEITKILCEIVMEGATWDTTKENYQPIKRGRAALTALASDAIAAERRYASDTTLSLLPRHSSCTLTRTFRVQGP